MNKTLFVLQPYGHLDYKRRDWRDDVVEKFGLIVPFIVLLFEVYTGCVVPISVHCSMKTGAILYKETLLIPFLSCIHAGHPDHKAHHGPHDCFRSQ